MAWSIFFSSWPERNRESDNVPIPNVFVYTMMLDRTVWFGLFDPVRSVWISSLNFGFHLVFLVLFSLLWSILHNSVHPVYFDLFNPFGLFLITSSNLVYLLKNEKNTSLGWEYYLRNINCNYMTSSLRDIIALLYSQCAVCSV